MCVCVCVCVCVRTLFYSIPTDRPRDASSVPLPFNNGSARWIAGAGLYANSALVRLTVTKR